MTACRTKLSSANRQPRVASVCVCVCVCTGVRFAPHSPHTRCRCNTLGRARHTPLTAASLHCKAHQLTAAALALALSQASPALHAPLHSASGSSNPVALSGRASQPLSAPLAPPPPARLA
eukprot:1700699-Rhodomonas_salina.1